MVADQRTGFPGSWVILAHMNPIGADGAGEIGTVVEDERHVVVGADPLDYPGPSDQVAVGEVLIPKLHDVHPTDDASLHESVEIASIRGTQVEPAIGQSPPLRRVSRTRQLIPDALALASAFICCLNWRTLVSAAGESMSATDWKVPGRLNGVDTCCQPGV